MFRCATFRLLAVSFLLLDATNLVTERVVAADRFWITSTGGSFNSLTNWSATDGGLGGASVPAAADIANFTLSNTYEVEFPLAGSLFNTDLDLEDGNVTFDLNGSTYTMTGIIPIVVGGIASQTGRLTVTEGILSVETLHDNVQVGTSDNATGFLTIAGDGQLGTAAVRPLMVIGQNGAGTLTVQNNGLAYSSDFLLGTNVGSTGSVTLTGPQATIDVSGSAQIGEAGTGTMTVSNGALLDGSSTTIGEDAGSTGTVTITGAGSRWIQSSSMAVGLSGVGTLNVQSGGELSTSGVTIGSATGSFGTATISSGGTVSTNAVTVGSSGTGALTVTGTGSSFDLNGTQLTVGFSGTGSGDVTVSAGGTIETGTASFGSSAGASGNLSITGSTSTFTSSGVFLVGFNGAATVDLTGGTLSTVTTRIANAAGSTGSVLVTGASSTWNTSTLAIGGALSLNGGAGTVVIEAGGTVNVSGATEIRSSAGSALTIDGGTLTTNDFTRLGTLNFYDGALHVKGAYDNGVAAGPLVIDGATASDLPTLRLSGNFAVTDVTMITVGNTNQAMLIVDSDRTINTGANDISIGSGALSSGTVTVTDASLETTGTLSVGGNAATEGGMGIVNINTGGIVEATTLRLFEQGTININGGTLQFSAFPTTSGKVNFNSGLALFENNINLTNSLLDTLLGPEHTLSPGRTMTGGIQVTVQSPLYVAGGTFSSASNNISNDSTLQISEGVVSTPAIFINNAGRLVVISGTGRLSAIGVTNNGTIQLDNNLIATSGGTLTNSGTIRGSGFIGNNLTNNAAGQVQAAAGSRLEFQGATNTNSGALSFVGGEIVFTGSLTNSASTGLIAGGDAVLRVNGGITNQGSVAISFGNNNLFGDINNTGSVIVTGGAHATFYDDITQNGTFIVREIGSTSSTAVVLGAFTGAGGSTGGGNIFFEGDLRPGNSAATVQFANNIGLGPGVTLQAELGGITPGVQYDQVQVTGSLALDGTLDVVLINGFSPTAGSAFDVLDWDTLSGTFATLQLPALGANLMWNASQLYTTGVLRVGLTGDYNLNGIVDGADYVVWRNTQGQTGVGLAADGDFDGQITVADYSVWRSRFGQTAPGSGAGATGAVVPEPASFVLLMAGGLLAHAGGCRQRYDRGILNRLIPRRLDASTLPSV
jgi:fibronectin-binding autotransporter adhesin